MSTTTTQTLAQIAAALQAEAKAGGNTLKLDDHVIQTDAFANVLKLMALTELTIQVSDPDKDIFVSKNSSGVDVLNVIGAATLYGTQAADGKLLITGEDPTSRTVDFTGTLASLPLKELIGAKLIDDPDVPLPPYTFSNVKADADSSKSSFSLLVPGSSQSYSILPKLDITLSNLGFGLSRANPAAALVVKLELTGEIGIGGSTVPVAVSIPVNAFAQPIFRLDFDPDKPYPVHLDKLYAILRDNNIVEFMPPGLAKAGSFVVSQFTVNFQYTKDKPPKVQINDISIQVDVTEYTIPIPGLNPPLVIKTAGVYFSLNFAEEPPQISLNVSGTLTLGNTTFDVTMSIPPGQDDWELTIEAETKLQSTAPLASLPGGFSETNLNVPAAIGNQPLTVSGDFAIAYNPASETIPYIRIGLMSESTWYFFGQVLGVSEPMLFLDISNPLESKLRTVEGRVSGTVSLSDTKNSIEFLVNANRRVIDSVAAWDFQASLVGETGEISLLSLLQKLIPSLPVSGLPNWVPAASINITQLEFTATENPGAKPPGSSYTLTGATDWKIAFGPLYAEGKAAATIAYESGKDATGNLTLFDFTLFAKLNFNLIYDFTPDNKSLTLEWDGFTATYNGGDTVVIEIGDWSFGDIVLKFVQLIQPSMTSLNLPAPWNVLNSLSLYGLQLEIDLTQPTKAPKIIYPLNKNLGFVELKNIQIVMTGQQVNVTIEYKFLIGEEQTKTWNAADPSQAPPTVPGDESTFDLKLLTLGQRIAVEGTSSFENIPDAISHLKGFPVPSDTDAVPVEADPSAGMPVFDQSVDWMIATHFILVEFLDLQAVFIDGQLYGLHVQVGESDKALQFQGLQFDILYKKISESEGVYQFELELPDELREISLGGGGDGEGTDEGDGSVDITLPVIGIKVFTNGDFLIDFGFPWDEDFARSAGAIVFPFAGAGGFYFGKLSGATSSKVPQNAPGRFDPVIEFGVAFEGGLGADEHDGPLYAQVTLTIVFILEGVVANWQPAKPSLTGGALETSGDIASEYYYDISGTAGVLGEFFGSIDFVIVKAELNVELALNVLVVFVAHRKTELELEFFVKVEITVEIHVIFTIHIHLSFKTTLKFSYGIGSDSEAPWDPPGLEAPVKSRLSSGPASISSRSPDWRPITGTPGYELTLFFTPHLSVTGDPTGSIASQTALYSAMFYMDAPPPADGSGTTPAPADITSFERLSAAVFLWTNGAFIEDPAVGDWEKLMNFPVSATHMHYVFCYLTQNKDDNPIPYTDIAAMLARQFSVNVKVPDASTNIAGTVFPMAPDLTLNVPSYKGSPEIDVDFGCYSTIDSAYITYLNTYFAQLQADPQTADQSKYGAQASCTSQTPKADGPTTQSMAAYVFENYFQLIARQMLQSGLNALNTFRWRLTGTLKPIDILTFVNDLKSGTEGNDLKLADMANANKGAPLTQGLDFKISGVQHQVGSKDSLESIRTDYRVTTLALITQNKDLKGLLIHGVQITLTINKKPTTYTIQPGDTFATVAANLQTDLTGLAAALLAAEGKLPQILTALFIVEIPPVDYVIQEDDTLSSVAEKFNLTVVDILEAGQNTVGFFYAPQILPLTKPTYLELPGLQVMTLGRILEVIQANQDFAHTAGMAARFLLHGTRVPVTADITNPADCSGKSSVPCAPGETCSLYQVMGQQFPLPALAAADANKFVINLKLNAKTRSRETDWINLPSTDPEQLTLPVSLDAINHINSVLTSARTQGIKPQYSLSALSMLLEHPRVFTLKDDIPVQSPENLSLPVSAAAETSPIVWKFSRGLLRVLGDSSPGYFPEFTPQYKTLKTKKQAASTSTVKSFGWGTLINLRIKKLPPGLTSKTARNTYELLGADGPGTALLLQLLNVTDLDTVKFGFYVMYQPNPAGQKPTGLQWDAGVQSFIAQANLSTETNPPSTSSAQATTPKFPDLDNPYEYLKLVWEASSVRSGGFYMYYADGGGSGLPGHVFDSRGVGEVQLLVIYNNSGDPYALTNFVNCIITGDKIDVSRTSLDLASQKQTVKHTLSASDSLDHIAGLYGLFPTDVAEQGATLVVNENISLSVTDLEHEVRLQKAGGAPETLEQIAAYYGTTADAIKQLNPVPGIDWNALKIWRLLKIPDVTYKTPAGKTLGEIAEYFGIGVRGLAYPNTAIPGLFEVTNPQKQPIVFAIDTQLLTKRSRVGPGFAGFQVSRTNPGSNPENDPAIYLEQQYNLLGYQIVDNLGFKASNEGLPAGHVSGSGDPESEIETRGAADTPWNYRKILPVPAFARTATETGTYGVDPYAGVGQSMQVRLGWQDVFGNRAPTPLALPADQVTGSLNYLPLRVRYTDKLIGVNRWPSTLVNYLFTGDGTKTPTLEVNFRFDTSRYKKPTKPTGQKPPAWQRRAIADARTFQNIYHQINHLDPDGTPAVTFTLDNTLNSKPVVLSGTDLSNVTAFVSTAYEYLHALATGGEAQPAPTAFAVQTPVAYDPTAGEQIFALHVTLSLSRKIDLVDDDFKDDAAISSAVTQLQPMTKDPSAATTASVLSLKYFAQQFEAAYSKADTFALKLLTGTAEPAAGAAKQIPHLWVLRYSATDGINISPPAGEPVFFAPRPLTNSLYSRGNTLVARYDPNTGKLVAETVSFNGIDMDRWGRICLEAIDQLLSPQYSVPLVKLGMTQPETDYLSQLLEIKKKLASSIAGNLSQNIDGTILNVLQTPAVSDPLSFEDAREKFRQALLVKLSSAYTIDVVVQYKFSVTSNYDGPTDLAPQLFGQPNGSFIFDLLFTLTAAQAGTLKDGTVSPEIVAAFQDNQRTLSTKSTVAVIQAGKLWFINDAPNDSTYEVILEKDEYQVRFSQTEQFSLSPGRLSLGNGKAPGTGKGTGTTYLSFPFSSKRLKELTSFHLSLDFDATHIEHEIETVAALDGYRNSKWLRFVLPVEKLPLSPDGTRIPALLRSFPPAPGLVAQNQQGYTDTPGQSSLEILENALLWDYEFTYSKLTAAQDSIDSTVQFNVQPQKTADDLGDGPDLFQVLAAFITAYPAISGVLLKDLEADSLDAGTANAMKALLQILNALPAAWESWHGKSSRPNESASGESDVQFLVEEKEDKDLLEVVISTGEVDWPKNLSNPEMRFAGYTAVPPSGRKEADPGGKGRTISTVNFKNIKTQALLTWKEAQGIADRMIAFPKLNATAIQNGWGAVQVIRNLDLVKGNPTNSQFLYETPFVRFSSKFSPLLDTTEKIYIEKIDGTPQKQLLWVHLRTFFSTLFKSDARASQMIKLECAYRYQAGSPELPPVELPVKLATTFPFQIPGDWNPNGDPARACATSPSENPFVCRLAGGILDWFEKNELSSTAATGQFRFQLSIFSSLSGSNLPIVRLENVLLDVGYITEIAPVPPP